MGIDQRKGIDQGVQNSIHQILPIGSHPHLLKESLFVTPVAEHPKVIEASYEVQELLKDLILLVTVLRPEGVTLYRIPFCDQDAD